MRRVVFGERYHCESNVIGHRVAKILGLLRSKAQMIVFCRSLVLKLSTTHSQIRKNEKSKEGGKRKKLTYPNTINTASFTKRVYHYSARTQPSRYAYRIELSIRWHMNKPFFPTTLSIPSYDIGKYVGLMTYRHLLVLLSYMIELIDQRT
jgi:hypothetical protein